MTWIQGPKKLKSRLWGGSSFSEAPVIHLVVPEVPSTFLPDACCCRPCPTLTPRTKTSIKAQTQGVDPKNGNSRCGMSRWPCVCLQGTGEVIHEFGHLIGESHTRGAGGVSFRGTAGREHTHTHTHAHTHTKTKTRHKLAPVEKRFWGFLKDLRSQRQLYRWRYWRFHIPMQRLHKTT